eukprot:9756571-Alexandrium_andersonii.AAC.1
MAIPPRYPREGPSEKRKRYPQFQRKSEIGCRMVSSSCHTKRSFTVEGDYAGATGPVHEEKQDTHHGSSGN